MATKQSVPSISPAKQPLERLDPPRSLPNFSLFTLSLFIVIATIITDMCPAQSTNVYSHFGPCLLATGTLFEDKRKSKHLNYIFAGMPRKIDLKRVSCALGTDDLIFCSNGLIFFCRLPVKKSII